MTSLDELWYQACENLDIPKEIAKKWLNTIQSKYNDDSNRFYHNLNVLTKKCEFIASIRPFVKHSDCLVFALAFQYFHFDLKSNCSELNCTSFREFYNDAGVDNINLLDSVCHLLEDSSKNFAGNTEDIDLFQDLDLIVLGSPESEYKEYQQATQKEYFHLDDATYKQTRLRILETFLQIPQIYLTPCISERLEDTARANIKREIAELKD